MTDEDIPLCVDRALCMAALEGHTETVRASRSRGKAGRDRLELRIHVLHTGGQGEAMVASEFLGDPAQFPPVMRDVHGFLHVDARPDNMAVFAAVVVDAKGNSARLPGKPQLLSGTLD